MQIKDVKGNELAVFEQAAHHFRLLADTTRLRILACLCTRDRTVSEVVATLGLTQANTSRHLNLLFRSGMVDRQRAGNKVRYRIANSQFVDVCSAVGMMVASKAASTTGHTPGQ